MTSPAISRKVERSRKEVDIMLVYLGFALQREHRLKQSKSPDENYYENSWKLDMTYLEHWMGVLEQLIPAVTVLQCLRLLILWPTFSSSPMPCSWCQALESPDFKRRSQEEKENSMNPEVFQTRWHQKRKDLRSCLDLGLEERVQ